MSALSFSPCGRYFAVGHGRLIDIWHTPATPESSSKEGLEFAPFVRHHVHAGHHDDVQSIEWSSDSRFFLSASKDLTARIWSVNAEGFVPTTLAGHRESLLGAWFSSDQESVISLLTATGSKANSNLRFIPSVKMVHCFVGNILKTDISIAIWRW